MAEFKEIDDIDEKLLKNDVDLKKEMLDDFILNVIIPKGKGLFILDEDEIPKMYGKGLHAAADRAGIMIKTIWDKRKTPAECLVIRIDY